jgi:hypothetical protein
MRRVGISTFPPAEISIVFFEVPLEPHDFRSSHGRVHRQIRHLRLGDAEHGAATRLASSVTEAFGFSSTQGTTQKSSGEVRSFLP